MALDFADVLADKTKYPDTPGFPSVTNRYRSATCA